MCNISATTTWNALNADNLQMMDLRNLECCPGYSMYKMVWYGNNIWLNEDSLITVVLSLSASSKYVYLASVRIIPSIFHFYLACQLPD